MCVSRLWAPWVLCTSTLCQRGSNRLWALGVLCTSTLCQRSTDIDYTGPRQLLTRQLPAPRDAQRPELSALLGPHEKNDVSVDVFSRHLRLETDRYAVNLPPTHRQVKRQENSLDVGVANCIFLEVCTF